MQQKMIQHLAARLALIGILFISAPALAQSSGTLSTGQCNLNSAQCAANGGTVTISSPSGAVTSSYNAALSQGAALVPVNVWNSCYYVDNSSANSVFVPFNSSAEWTAFVNNKPNSISLTTCGLPYSVSGASQTASVAPPYAGCTPVVINNPNVYGRTGSVWPTTPLSQNFTCGGTSVASALQWTAGNSNTTSTGQLSWNQSFKFGPDLKLKAQDTTTGGAAATSITITSGDIVKLTWSSTSAYGNIVSETPGGWSGAHGATIQPIAATQTTFTYTLTSTDSNGLSSTATVTVTVIPANCPANAAQSWVVNGTTCSGPLAATNNGASNSVTATNGPTGTASFICNNGTYAENGGATCTPVPLNCGMQSVSWTVGSTTCSGTVAATTSGNSSSVSGSGVNGATGSASFACTNGVYSQNSGATCVAPPQLVGSCSGTIGFYTDAIDGDKSYCSIDSSGNENCYGTSSAITTCAALGYRLTGTDGDSFPNGLNISLLNQDAQSYDPSLMGGFCWEFKKIGNSTLATDYNYTATFYDKPSCPSYSFTAGFAACPTACGTPASTLSPSSCTRSDGASVDVSYCSDQTESCNATAACPVYSCNPSSVANGSVGAYPGCGITCNSGYTLSGGTCVPNTCSPSSVANGSVGAYPGCGITCNSGYTNVSGTCVSTTTCPGGSWPAGPYPNTGYGPYGFIGSVPAASVGTTITNGFSACTVTPQCGVLRAVCGKYAPGTYSGLGTAPATNGEAFWAIYIASPWAGGFFETIVGNPPNP